jgi:hypothetical protein
MRPAVGGRDAFRAQPLQPPVGLGLGVAVPLGPLQGGETAFLVAAVVARDPEQQVSGSGQSIKV